jgi:hypothetical protein
MAFEPFSALSVINERATAADAATLIPIDAVQEFNVEKNAKAQYGWKPSPGGLTSEGALIS